MLGQCWSFRLARRPKFCGSLYQMLWFRDGLRHRNIEFVNLSLLTCLSNIGVATHWSCEIRRLSSRFRTRHLKFGIAINRIYSFTLPMVSAQRENLHVLTPKYSFMPLDSERAVVYELHIGSFTSEGTFAATNKLDHLKALGINVVQLLPVLHYCSEHKTWGYDPCAPYGRLLPINDSGVFQHRTFPFAVPIAYFVYDSFHHA